MPSETTCSVCGFLLDVDAKSKYKRWYDFIVESEYLFLKYTFSDAELQEMRLGDIKKCYKFFDRVTHFCFIFKKALETEGGSDEFKNFIEEEKLGKIYSGICEITDDITNMVVKTGFLKK